MLRIYVEGRKEVGGGREEANTEMVRQTHSRDRSSDLLGLVLGRQKVKESKDREPLNNPGLIREAGYCFSSVE